MSKVFTVIIPTYCRCADLQRVLEALEAIEVPQDWNLEIVVVDDGSNDGTDAFLASWSGPFRVSLRQANAGPAKARNAGARAARGELIAFLGDDTIPHHDWLCEHIETHRLDQGEGALAVLGLTTFPSDDETPFLRWINEYGAQFGYSIIEDPKNVPFNFFYTSNISLSRRIFLDHDGFREDFPAAAWEDIEFAYRATRDGMRIVYQARARTIHCHRIRPTTFCRRQRTAGRSGAIFAQLHPELRDFIGMYRLTDRRAMPAFLRWFYGRCVAIGEWIPGIVPVGLYQRWLDEFYLDGLAEGLHSSERG
jgi:GT2 family glycosyltransferase